MYSLDLRFNEASVLLKVKEIAHACDDAELKNRYNILLEKLDASTVEQLLSATLEDDIWGQRMLAMVKTNHKKAA